MNSQFFNFQLRILKVDTRQWLKENFPEVLENLSEKKRRGFAGIFWIQTGKKN